MQPVPKETPVYTTSAQLDPATPPNSPVEMSSTVDKSFASVSSQGTIDATMGRPFTLRHQQVDAMPQSFLNAQPPPVTERPTSELIDDYFSLATIPAPLGDVTTFNKSLFGASGSRTTRRPTPELIDNLVPLQSSPTPAHPYIGKHRKRTRLEWSVGEDDDTASVMSQSPIKKLRLSSAGIKFKPEPVVAEFENGEELGEELKLPLRPSWEERLQRRGGGTRRVR
ncbi:hypothetical protein BDU57DRAFT_513330 [Ampelomyces quisqualis]|uniref:Uncharacterized protein n=1 Tax=Ampelomyces quisqualis TaxID=50730 RepID=A0A6A5QX38_AMPQU|nr:hypothetical protein BDU57DRAFT_513330 [Ampelomyces quisqualis]